MRIVIFAYGSRGDVQPFVALAQRLRRAGHVPVLAAPGRYAWLAEQHGVTFVPVDDQLNDFFLTDPDVIAVQALPKASLRLLVRTWRGLRRELDRCLPIMLEQMLGATRDGADLIIQVYDEIPVEQGHHVAEALGIPWVLATLSPNFVPSFSYPAKMLPTGRRYPAVVNRLSHLLRIGMRSIGSGTVRRFRRETLGLPNRRRQNNRLRAPDGSPVPVIHAFSPDLLRPAPDWPSWVYTPGFFFLPDGDENAGPTAELMAFLDAGEPPICVSFGSVEGMDPLAAGTLVVDAVRQAGVRAVIVQAGGSIQVGPHPPEVMVVDEIAYSWLFPRISLVVHGGSVGISSEALRAGIPQVSCPPVGEALAWATTITDAGVAPPPIMQRDLTAANLAAAVERAVTDPGIAVRVRRLADRLQLEDGTGAAVQAIEEIALAAGRGRDRVPYSTRVQNGAL